MLTSDPSHQSSIKDVGDDDKVANASNESEVGTTITLKTSPFCPVKGSESRRIDQSENDSCEVAKLDKVPESESGSARHHNVAGKCNVMNVQSTSHRRAGRDVAGEKRRLLAVEIVAEQKRRELEEGESRFEQKIETQDGKKTRKMVNCETPRAKVIQQERELLEKSAEVSSGVSSRYSIGTKVKKVSMGQEWLIVHLTGILSLILVFFQFFEGHGWFTGEVAAYNGELYRVVYEDGDSEEYDDDEIENIVLTSDPSHQSSSKDVGDDDKAANAANEAEVGTTSALKTSPSRPVKGCESRHIDQSEKDSCEVAVLDKVPESESRSAVHQHMAGKSNVMFVQSIVHRQAVIGVAGQKRRQLMDKSATTIQAAWRCYCGRSIYESKLLGILLLQRIVRGRAARNVAKRKRELGVQSAIVIQAAWRGCWALSSYESKIFSLIVLQSLARRRAAKIIAEQKRRELEKRESCFEQKIELLEKSAEVLTGVSSRYLIGTKVKKVSMNLRVAEGT